MKALQATLLSEVVAAKAAAAAENYFSRLAAAGDTTHVAYKQPLTNYISSLVALGGAYWDDMLSACSFVGVGIQGVTVPLRSGMTVPTNNNFVAGDLNQLTGLEGDSSSKWINTNVNGASLLQDDASGSVYVMSGRDTGANRYFEAQNIFSLLGNTTGARGRTHSSTLSNLGTGTTVPALAGWSRDNSADFDYLVFGQSATTVLASTGISTNDIGIFANAAGQNASAARLAIYHVGPALNLATLEALQATLITEIAAI